ncbi:MAG: CHASE domain-containing protein [Comamonadaceae bacterium]|nr:CHASE domain-containing protein [Burkholderiales bacterium]MEB2347488.1 CHASE domain-containing protein [Comamonadaceae bacterium]
MSLSACRGSGAPQTRRTLVLGLLAAAGAPWAWAAHARDSGAAAALLRAHLNGYADVLRGLQALVQLRPDLTRREFERTASEMDLLRRHPGLIEVALVRHVPPDGREAFLQAARTDVHLSGRVPVQFAIHPPLPEGAAYVLTCLWPSAGRDAALGFELHAAPALLQACERSGSTGELVASAPWSMRGETAPVQALVLAARDHRTAESGQEGRLVGAVLLVFSPAEVARALTHALGQPVSLADGGADGAAGPQDALTVDWGTRRWRLQ